ncbi:MAG TPA: SAM-dependent methyltransferase [Acidimicrobiales bacterium]|nr:SAM-dependent methyltransferase [Acidimicrobiales bacterium]
MTRTAPTAAVPVPVVHLVGAGPGDPMLLTRRAARLLAAADVVVLDRRSLDPIAALAPPAAERIFVGRADVHPAWDTDAIADLLADRARNGVHCAENHQKRGVLAQPIWPDQSSAQPTAVECAENHQERAVFAQPIAADQRGPTPTVVRLKSGDPFVCSRGGEEMTALGARGIHVEVTPGVSAATAAPLAAGLTRGRSVTILAGNHDPLHPDTDVGALADPDSSLVVLVGRSRQAAIADALVGSGLDPGTPAAVVHAATRAGARVVHTTVGELGAHRLPPPATVVIGPAEVHRAHP